VPSRSKSDAIRGKPESHAGMSGHQPENVRRLIG
jgi:hypothetical protein